MCRCEAQEEKVSHGTGKGKNPDRIRNTMGIGQQNTCVRYAFNSSVELGGDDAWQVDWEERRHEG